MFSFKEKSHESATDRRKIGVLGVPPNDPPERQGPRGLDPVIDLKSLWRSLSSFPHQRGGPQEHKPRDSMGRAAKPEQSAFSAVLGSDCSPRAKGVCRPEASATPGQGIGQPQESSDFRPNLENPLSLGTPRFLAF